MGPYNAWMRGILILMLWSGILLAPAVAQVRDPGVRAAATDGGPPVPLPGLIAIEQQFFQDGLNRFTTVEVVSGATTTQDVSQGNGLGPRFNSNSCVSCDEQTYRGGWRTAANTLYAKVNAEGAGNQMPWFEAENGPVRE